MIIKTIKTKEFKYTKEDFSNLQKFHFRLSRRLHISFLFFLLPGLLSYLIYIFFWHNEGYLFAIKGFFVVIFSVYSFYLLVLLLNNILFKLSIRNNQEKYFSKT